MNEKDCGKPFGGWDQQIQTLAWVGTVGEITLQNLSGFGVGPYRQTEKDQETKHRSHRISSYSRHTGRVRQVGPPSALSEISRPR
jgi:hypothetical protein